MLHEAEPSHETGAAGPGPDPREPLGRRRFLQVLGFGLSGVIGAGGTALAQAAGKRPGRPGAPPAAAPTAAPPAPPAPPAAPDGPPPLSEDARSLAEIVRRRYGKHLTPDQLEAVTRELDQRVQAGRRLRDAKLANADEPDFTFRVEP